MKLNISKLILFQIISFSFSAEFFNTEECGKGRACWSFPADCEPRKCDGIVRWRLEGQKLVLEIQAKDISMSTDVGRYVAVGFSGDQAMGNDTVIECVFDNTGEGRGQAYISHNEQTNNIQLLKASQKMLKNKSFVMKDDRLMCKLEVDFSALSTVDKSEKEMIHEIPNNNWHLLFAEGLTNLETGEKYMHAVMPWKTQEQVEICSDCKAKLVLVEKMSQ
uniref:DOMON domain-containing protein n=1 Tax=Ditylenchus dipsaci TaxID=166011 RepID=A0A915CSJ1_9BILA